MRFKEVAELYQNIEAVNPKRLQILSLLSKFIEGKYRNREIRDIQDFCKLTLGKFEVNKIASDFNKM